jgi:DNA-binding transcriptional ArsR family regulator
MGKSYGAVAAAVETNTPVTILTGRGRKEQYGVLRDWAAQQGLDVGDKGQPNGDVYVLPSFKKDCPTANGEAGDGWEELVGRWYAAGASPSHIHAYSRAVLEHNDEIEADDIPCQHEGSCAYTRKWDFDPDDFEILIGHYSHGHRPKVVTGSERNRTVVLDEFPESYETELRGDSLRSAINQYLADHGRSPSDGLTDDRADDDPPAIPYRSFDDLLTHRDDADRREAAVAYLEYHGVDTDEDAALHYADGDGQGETPDHALAPLAIYTILATAVGGTLGNGYYRTELPHDRAAVGVFDEGGDDVANRFGVSLLRPPQALDFADKVVALDGTPTVDMWELATGLDFTHEVVLEDRRAEYVEAALGYRIVPTTDYVKPYNSDQHVNSGEDAALLEAITSHHDQRPAVVTTSTARYVWGNDDDNPITLDDDNNVVEGPVSGLKIYGNILGSNRFADEDLGVVVGSNHYGDGFIRRWGAYAGKAVQRQAVDGEDTAKGKALSYGTFGDKVHRHMREHDTLQSLFRFGRNTDGATIYVATDTLPDWLPTHGRGDVVTSDGLAVVLRALDELDVASPSAIHDHNAVEISRRQVQTHLSRLRDLGVVGTTPDPEDGRKTLYSVENDDTVTQHGLVDLPDHENLIGKGSATAYVREPGDGDSGDDTDAVEADGGNMRKITPAKLIDMNPIEISVETTSNGFPQFTVDVGFHIRTTDDDGRVWYLHVDDGETQLKKRGVTPYTRRRRRLPRREGTNRVGTPSRRRAGRSRFASEGPPTRDPTDEDVADDTPADD